jgi:DNA invertase Pin-like site-specific DNA recombinase
MIGERTKRALAAAKDRGTKLGGFRGRAATAEDRARASASLTPRVSNRFETCPYFRVEG